MEGGPAFRVLCEDSLLPVKQLFLMKEGGGGDTAHLGMNVRIPTPALASTSSAGFTLYCIRISSTPTAMAAVSVPVMAPLAMLTQPASSNPIDTGASPCGSHVLHGHFSSFFHASATTNASTAVGPKKAPRTAIAPRITPAQCRI